MKFEDIHKLMLSGKIYNPSEISLMKKQIPRIEACHRFNNTKSTLFGFYKRNELLKKYFKSIGNNCYIEPPIYANCFGLNVKIGNNFYSNFGLTMVDDGEIEIGSNIMFGPHVTLITANHPISPDLRKDGIQYNKKIVISDGVWLGANVTVMPGVTIGKNSIIGACSMVNKDIPDNVIAFGNPAKVYRKITEEDYKIYDHDKEIPIEFLSEVK